MADKFDQFADARFHRCEAVHHPVAVHPATRGEIDGFTGFDAVDGARRPAERRFDAPHNRGSLLNGFFILEPTPRGAGHFGQRGHAVLAEPEFFAAGLDGGAERLVPHHASVTSRDPHVNRSTLSMAAAGVTPPRSPFAAAIKGGRTVHRRASWEVGARGVTPTHGSVRATALTP